MTMKETVLKYLFAYLTNNREDMEPADIRELERCIQQVIETPTDK